MSKTMALTQHKGKIYHALVDDEDFIRVNQYRWHVRNHKHAHQTHYAYRRKEIKGGGRITIRLHRFILGLSKTDKIEVDHLNFNGLDNRRANLRIATRQENCRHRRKQHGAKQSQYKGVYWEVDRKKWRAYIYVNKKKIWINRFIDEISAAKAYNNKASELFGEYAYLNRV